MIRRLLPMALVALFLARPLAATWSIILIDLRTGEIAIASATCVPGFNLRNLLPVVVVGHGAAAAQSQVDSSGLNRRLIQREFLIRTDPSQILGLLAAFDPSHQTRQYGFVDVQGRTAAFSGNQVNQWFGERTGRFGSIAYSIQGNILTGAPVVDAALQAVQSTHGDLADRLMAGMEAAAALGGDSRCSPTKSSDIGFMIVARPGDGDGDCNVTVGCAFGSYHLTLDVANQPRSAPDAVLQLRAAFDAWRVAQVGRPDHFLSSVEPEHRTLPADGITRSSIRVVLRDRSGARIRVGGAGIQAVVDPTHAVELGVPIDLGDGTYRIPVTAGTFAQPAAIRITVDDGNRPVLLSPLVVLQVTDDMLWTRRDLISVRDGGTIEFVVRAAPVGRPRTFVMLASASGSAPGLRLGNGLTLPLNLDPILEATAAAAAIGVLPGLVTTLPASGRAETCLLFPPASWGLPSGYTLSFAGALLDPLDTVSNPVEVGLVR